jgi:G3E family GTPase
MPKSKKVGAIINDVGQLNVDSRRVEVPEEDVMGFSSGCICHERREDLYSSLKSKNLEKYDELFIEGSGSANPYDLMGVVADAGLRLKHHINVVPIKHYPKIMKKTSFLSGVQSANLIAYSWIDKKDESYNSSVDSLEKNIKKLNPEAKVLDDNNIISYSFLENFPKWSPRNLGMNFPISGHEHYNTIVMPINPSLAIEEIENSLREIASAGVERAKGFLPDHGKTFDIVNGSLEIRDYDGDGVSPYIVVINKNLVPLKPIQKISLDKGGKASFAIRSSEKSDYLQMFDYFRDKSVGDTTSNNGAVQAYFEATDEAFHAAREIESKFGDKRPVESFLPHYIEIRLKALDNLESISQTDRSYTGSILCSYVIEANNTYGGFDGRIDEVATKYFRYLSEFGVQDLEKIKSYPEYGKFLQSTARSVAKRVSKDLVSRAAQNMSSIFATVDENLSTSWRQLYDESM